jgi:MYXO-CTERM domain-containing protein
MVPEVATACGSYNSAQLCGTIEWTEPVDLGEDVVGLVVHGGFASAQQYDFDGLGAGMQAGHGKALLLCGANEDWCLDQMQAILDAEVRGGFVFVTGWDGFNAPSVAGLPMGVWAEDAVFSASMLEVGEESNDGMAPLNIWSESFAKISKEEAANTELCRSAASLGSAIHPGEMVIDLTPSTVRVNTGMETFEPSGAAVFTIAPPGPALRDRDSGFAFDSSVDGFDAESLRVLTGELNEETESSLPQAGCSVATGASSAVSMLGGAFMLFALGLLRRREVQAD